MHAGYHDSGDSLSEPRIGRRAQFDAIRSHGLVHEAPGYLAEDFKTVAHVGPVAVADFQEMPRGEDRELVLRDACERVLALVARVRTSRHWGARRLNPDHRRGGDDRGTGDEATRPIGYSTNPAMRARERSWTRVTLP